MTCIFTIFTTDARALNDTASTVREKAAEVVLPKAIDVMGAMIDMMPLLRNSSTLTNWPPMAATCHLFVRSLAGPSIGSVFLVHLSDAGAMIRS